MDQDKTFRAQINSYELTCTKHLGQVISILAEQFFLVFVAGLKNAPKKVKIEHKIKIKNNHFYKGCYMLIVLHSKS